MLLHLSPRFYFPFTDSVNVVDINIPELNLRLTDKAITQRKPFPNKLIYSVCRKKGKKAINGLFIETDHFIRNFTLITKWRINYDYGEEIITHQIHYHIKDDTFDAVSDYKLARCVLADNENDVIYYKTIPKAMNLSFIVNMVEYAEIQTVKSDHLKNSLFENERLPAYSTDTFPANVVDYDYTIKPTKIARKLGIFVSEIKSYRDDLLNSESKSAYEIEYEHLDEIHIKIIDEILSAETYFFTNTTDLVSKAKQHSALYKNLSDKDKHAINLFLTQPLFQLVLPDVD